MNTSLFDRILVPTDMSEFSDPALRYALLFHEQLGSKITLLHAQEISWLNTENPLGYYFDNVPEMKLTLLRRLDEYTRTHVPGSVQAAQRFEDDIPERAIVAGARHVGADLIIMGTHGRRGLRRAILGSITERVLHTADIPVITVAPEAMAPRVDPGIRTVLCPVNFTDLARHALQQACVVTEAFGARLVVAYVAQRSEPELRSTVEEQFKAWVDSAVRGETEYVEIVAGTDPTASILDAAEMVGPDLLVMGAHHKLFEDATIVATTMSRITRSAHYPVMTVIPSASAHQAVA